ncbi:hypothetical protein PG995_010687 [Apiospora arundinis]
MSFAMTPGTTAPPPPRFTPPPECAEALSHLYRTTIRTYSTSTIIRDWWRTSTPTTTAAPPPPVCTALSDKPGFCAYYNLGHNYDRTCLPVSNTYYSTSLTAYSGCPVGYTTACHATNRVQRLQTPYWPSTEIIAKCCPTHAEYIFTCAGLSSSTASDWYYTKLGGWTVDIGTDLGCHAPAVPPSVTEVLLVTSSTVPAPDSVWIDTRTRYRDGSALLSAVTTQTVTGRLTYATSTITSTGVVLRPGQDWVSARGVVMATTVWGQQVSTCWPFSGKCATPEPMWDYDDYWWEPPRNAPWPVSPRYGSTGIAAVVCLCVVSFGFFFSVLGVWRKGRRLHERREQIRLRLINETARPRDTYYGQ